MRIMVRYRLEIEYFGAGYAGWQKQGERATIQKALEDAAKALSGQPARSCAAGRTDAGVHALAMSAHIDIEKKLPAKSVLMGLNFHLQKAGHNITVLRARKAVDGFHARFSCLRRRYIYRILNRPTRPALEAGRAWWVPQKLDCRLMDKVAQNLVGRHDFSTFRGRESRESSPVKTLDSISAAKRNGFIIVKTAARSFMHHQVRNMVGALKLVGEGKWSEDDFMAAFEARDRKQGGPSAPAAGLYFEKAEY
jgi:tRNA pseudouridine38-40 synthase